MSSKLRFWVVALVTSLLFVVASGCAHNKPAEDESSPVESTDLGSSDTGNALGLKTVHFEFDASTLTKEGRATLKDDSKILKANPSVAIQVEGHCDARGGIQYNLALGERRAKSVRDYLVDHGVEGSRVTTISYGKERPIDPGNTEEAYAKNRRANLVVTKK